MATHRELLALRLKERTRAKVLTPEECDRLLVEYEAEKKAREAAVREDDGDATR